MNQPNKPDAVRPAAPPSQGEQLWGLVEKWKKNGEATRNRKSDLISLSATDEQMALIHRDWNKIAYEFSGDEDALWPAIEAIAHIMFRSPVIPDRWRPSPAGASMLTCASELETTLAASESLLKETPPEDERAAPPSAPEQMFNGIPASELVEEVLSDRKPLTLEEWLQARLDNCVRLGNLKNYSARAGWIEDAAFFRATLMKLERLSSALQGILDIGKRDMSNPKYDGYFKSARNAIDGGDL